MDCFYLMMQVELALALALDGIEKDDLPRTGTWWPFAVFVAAVAAQVCNFQKPSGYPLWFCIAQNIL